jgi:hypothetical protein
LQSKAKLDIDALIVTCGVALMHGRRARDLISDPHGRSRLEVSIKAIEAMIEMARVKAGELLIDAIDLIFVPLRAVALWRGGYWNRARSSWGDVPNCRCSERRSAASDEKPTLCAIFAIFRSVLSRRERARSTLMRATALPGVTPVFAKKHLWKVLSDWPASHDMRSTVQFIAG